MKNKEIINHGTLHDSINYEALIEAQANNITYIDNELSSIVKPNSKSKAKKLTKYYTRGTLNKK